MKNDKHINPFLIGDTNLMDRINSKLNWELDELVNLVATTLHNEIILQDNIQNDWYLALPESIKAICANTNGQIVYKQQAVSIYCLFTNAQEVDAEEWVKNWNKKKPNARAIVSNIFIGSMSMAELINKLSAYHNSHFFIEKPLEDAKLIYEFLENQNVLTRCGLDIRNLKVGDITYEYARLVKEHWDGFKQYKTYHQCVVCIVTKAPTIRKDGCWEWEVEQLSNQRIIKYTVCKDCLQGAPYLFNHKRWDAENYT
jgi:hypothetical protein